MGLSTTEPVSSGLLHRATAAAVARESLFAHPDVPELVNLQEVDGEAKPYQIRQFLRLVERYALTLEEQS